jgi:hypothetical protein
MKMKRPGIVLLWLVAVLMGWGAGALAGEDVFVRPSLDTCLQVKATAEKTFKKSFVLNDDAPFVYMIEDPEGVKKDAGRGCSLSAKGTGVDFPDLPGVEDLKLEEALVGWTPVTGNSVYGGYGSSGGRSALTRDGNLMVIEVGWEATPKAQALVAKKCPQMPIDACAEYIQPKQKLVTFDIFIARRAQ